MHRKRLWGSLIWLALGLLLALPILAIGEKEEDDAPATIGEPTHSAQIVKDEGGPLIITGQLSYTNALFTNGVDDPLIILEDQAGFIDRDEYYILPLESQVLGSIHHRLLHLSGFIHFVLAASAARRPA